MTAPVLYRDGQLGLVAGKVVDGQHPTAEVVILTQVIIVDVDHDWLLVVLNLEGPAVARPLWILATTLVWLGLLLHPTDINLAVGVHLAEGIKISVQCRSDR